MNSNKFEFMGLVAGTKFWSLRLHFFTKMGTGSSHEETLCVPTLMGQSSEIFFVELVNVFLMLLSCMQVQYYRN